MERTKQRSRILYEVMIQTYDFMTCDWRYEGDIDNLVEETYLNQHHVTLGKAMYEVKLTKAEAIEVVTEANKRCQQNPPLLIDELPVNQ